MSEEQTKAPAGAGSTAPGTTDPVAVVGEFLIIDGCKVARVEGGGVIAFRDTCRRRLTKRGTDQVRVSVDALAEVVHQSEK